MTTNFQGYVARRFKAAKFAVSASADVARTLAEDVELWLPERYEDAVRYRFWEESLAGVIADHCEAAVARFPEAYQVWEELNYPEESEFLSSDMSVRGMVTECARSGLEENLGALFQLAEEAIEDYEEDHGIR